MLLREIASLSQNETPLSLEKLSDPKPTEGEILLRVTRCGVCHTELDEIEGRTPPAHLPVVLGHQVVGIIMESGGSWPTQERTLTGIQAPALHTGQRVGVAWIASACGHCQYCLSGQENLCPEFKATGRDIDGGYAENMNVRADFVHPIPDSISDSETAPLLCAGAVGYRALKLSNLQDGHSLGLMGFGGSNHLVLKAAKYKFPNSPIIVFSRNPS